MTTKHKHTEKGGSHRNHESSALNQLTRPEAEHPPSPVTHCSQCGDELNAHDQRHGYTTCWACYGDWS